MVAELIREAALEGVRDELPHSLAVVVDEIVPRDGPAASDVPLLDVRVHLFVERDSQKAIIIGKGGARLRDVGTEARREIEALLGGASTSTCTSRSPRTGSATPSSCSASASDDQGILRIGGIPGIKEFLGITRRTSAVTSVPTNSLIVGRRAGGSRSAQAAWCW